MFNFFEDTMFDLNGDGKIDIFEQAVAYEEFLYNTDDEEDTNVYDDYYDEYDFDDD